MKLDTSYGEENYYLQEKAYKILMKNNFDNAIDDHLLKLILASLRSMYKNHEFRYSWSDYFVI
ncbi:hypothetical protein lpari_00913 [Legionella parisiensis]|uniref:Uncharacterized protein n=2 Tax=Legionella parisiensis TaxID=45071 RepID=A0A1E5JU77_9GAMM|nr:hypothetical protein lpari_00913 [Legionella parisiensis]